MIRRFCTITAKWHRFFYEERPLQDMAWLSGLTEYGEMSKIMQALRESHDSDFSNMYDQDMLKALTIFNNIKITAIRRGKDVAFIDELRSRMAFKIETEKSVEWTPRMLKYFSKFISDQKVWYLQVMSEQTFSHVLEPYREKYLDFHINELACFLHAAVVMPIDSFDELEAAFTEKFNTFETLKYTNDDELASIMSAAFIRIDPQTNQRLEVSVNKYSLPQFEKLIDRVREIISRRPDNVKYTTLLQPLQYVVDYDLDSFYTFVAESIAENIDINDESLTLKRKNVSPYSLMSTIKYFPTDHRLAKELFMMISQKLFISHFVVNQVSANLFDIQAMKIQFFMEYLKQACRFNVYQVFFLDLAVKHMADAFTSKNNRFKFEECAEIFYSLAYLNYPSRYGTKFIHKELQWEHWQYLSEQLQTMIQQNLENESTPADQENITETTGEIELDEKLAIQVTKILWSLAVLDIYSRPLIEACIKSLLINADGLVLNDKTAGMLLQAHYYLSHEYSGEFALPTSLVEQLTEYQTERNEQPLTKLPESTEFRDAIRRTIDAKLYRYEENHLDFPYLIDFANVDGPMKQGVLVDDENAFMDCSDGCIRSGADKLKLRQLAHLGWDIKRFHIRNWIRQGNLEIFKQNNKQGK